MKTALVTGGSRGIGAEIVRILCKRGWQVIFTYLGSEEKALAVALKNGADAALAIIDKGVPEAANRFNGATP